MRKVVWLSAVLLPVIVFYSYNPDSVKMPAPDNPEFMRSLMPAPDKPAGHLAAQMPAPDNPAGRLAVPMPPPDTPEAGLEPIPMHNPEVEGYSIEEMPAPDNPEEPEEMPAPDNPIPESPAGD